MIKMIIDDFKVPIIKKGVSSVSSLKNEFINKKIISIWCARSIYANLF